MGRVHGPQGQSSDSGGVSPTVWIIVGVLVGVIVVFGIPASIFYYLRQRERLAKTPVLGKVAKNDEHFRLLKEWEPKVTKEADAREKEIELAGKGERVWFSRYIESGRVKHWVIIINGAKYELRRTTTGDDGAHDDEAAIKYQSRITKDPGWADVLARRRKAVETIGYPEVDGFYICLIGWTALSEAEMQEVARGVDAEFGRYNLLWNNCQHFLKSFADGIVSDRAADWVWFREHMRTEYQGHMTPPRPPYRGAAVVAANLMNI